MTAFFASAKSDASCLYFFCSSSSRCSWVVSLASAALLRSGRDRGLALRKRPEACQFLQEDPAGHATSTPRCRAGLAMPEARAGVQTQMLGVPQHQHG